MLYPISNGASQMLNSQCEQALYVHCTKICNVTNANTKCKQALRLRTYFSWWWPNWFNWTIIIQVSPLSLNLKGATKMFEVKDVWANGQFCWEPATPCEWRPEALNSKTVSKLGNAQFWALSDSYMYYSYSQSRDSHTSRSEK